MEIGPLVSAELVTVGPDHSLAETARRMIERGVGSAVVVTEDGRPGIITERDLLRSLAAGNDPESTRVERYMTENAITASPSWDVTEAASRMVDGGFRHLLVLNDNGSISGVLSIRDLVASLLGSRP
ncbi:CBS domain-containing protein [soil metagenome]